MSIPSGSSAGESPSRRWHPSLRQQLIGLVVLFALVSVAGAFYQRNTSINDQVDRSRQGVIFRGQLASSLIGKAIASARNAVDAKASFLSSIGSIGTCLGLRFVPVGPFRRGHTDLLGPDGKPVCTTAHGAESTDYSAAPWLNHQEALTGPYRDPESGQQTIVIASPIKGNVGTVVTFLVLTGVLNRLATRLSGPLTSRFTLIGDGGTTVAQSPPLNNGEQISATVPVSSVGWRLHVNTSRDAALAGTLSLSNRLFLYIAIAFILLLIAVQLVYGSIARPIRRLSAAVRGVVPGDVPPGLTAPGPAEVVSLGEAFTTMTTAVRDELSARREAEAEAARAAEERDAQAAMLNLVVQSSPALIYVKDLDGRYLMVNEAYERAVGLAPESVIGRTDAEVDPRLDSLWHDNDQRAREGLFQLEETFKGPRGTRHYEGVKFPLHDASGKVYAICGVSLDVTEQRLAIATTAQARDAALAANAAKSAFLATMSHEIRTPMNAVIGMTDLLEQTELDAQQHEFVTTVRSSGEALMAVINNVLDFSKIESGELELEHAPFVVREEIEGCLTLVARQASAKGLDLFCYVSDRSPTRVMGDALRLRQILTNLLSNAVKFTDTGEVLVEVDASESDEEHLRLTISVTDTGIGIPEASRARLFRSFSQVDASTTRLYGGTGLGLAISRRLAQAMGGDITVSDNPKGRGTRFTVAVFVERCPEAAYPSGRADVTAPILAGRSVLLVDNNETNLRILELQLTRLGMTCTTASTAEGALELVRNGLTYDVAVLDMRMPNMDGIELGNSLKQLPGPSAAAPLILLTSIGFRRDQADQSFAALLTKPVKSTSLRDMLTALLSERAPKPRGTDDSDEEPDIQPRRILLAEDNLVNQRVVQLMLKNLGHTVDVVSDGVEAVQAVERAQYDVVLMDVQMPRMDGLEATRRIRTDVPTGRQPHIVALTASALVEDREACAAAGMEAYLTKPIRKRELQAMLDRTTAAAPTPAG